MRVNKIALDDVTEESHISSFIVLCRAEKHKAVEQELQQQADIEVHGSDEKGKFVVVTEAKHQGIIMDRIDLITAIDGVINTSMVYHQVAALDELDDEIEQTDQPIEQIHQPQLCEVKDGEAPSDIDAATLSVQ